MKPQASRLPGQSRRRHQRKRFHTFALISIIITLYLIISAYFVSPWVLHSQAMAPKLASGTRILVLPYLTKTAQGHLKNPPSRGDIVAIHPPYIPETPWYLGLFDPIVRLLTLQNISLNSSLRHEWENERTFKRIIGVPGDTIRMEKSLAYVKSEGNDQFVSEFELNQKTYDVDTKQPPTEWKEDMPFSGHSAPLPLASNQYFVLGDNRSGSNDSRYWGSIHDSSIRGRVVFVYWPLKSFGPLR